MHHNNRGAAQLFKLCKMIMATFIIPEQNQTFEASSFASALDFCTQNFDLKIDNLVCKTKTREQQFVLDSNNWIHLPYVGCSEGDVISNINDVVLL